MNENDFWAFIGESKLKAKGDLDRQAGWLERRLKKSSKEEILDFDRLLHEQMRKSYTRELWAAAYIINGGCSDDGFDYFRTWLIAQGKDVFNRALSDPESMAETAEADVEFEDLLYVAVKAFETKTKGKFPYPSYPEAVLTGAEWEEDEAALAIKYPKLHARFGGAAGGEANGTIGTDTASALDALQELLGHTATGVPNAQMLYTQALLLTMNGTPENLAKSAEFLTQAADQGHASAQALLGINLQEGVGVPQNYAEAAKRYRQAAEQGNAEGLYGLGSLYLQGQGVAQDYAEALNWLQKGAEAGSADSEFQLGLLYCDGLGVEKNYSEAFKWFRRAAQNGHEQGALNAGLYYLNGKGVAADAREAFALFQQAAEAGSARARFNLGVMYENGQGVKKDLTKAVEMYQQAAEEGSADAKVNLGLCYSNGKGVEQDYAKAAELYRQASEEGKLTATSNLAVLYQHGRGVPQDTAEAVRLYRQCAEAGSAAGQYNLGTMYHRGIGVAQDDVEAVRWYRLAAEQENAAAMNNLGDAYENGYGVSKDYAQAAQWYHQAADKGKAISHYSLGTFYRDGLGVKRDYSEAETHFKAAAEGGIEKAQAELEALYDAGHVPRQRPVVPISPKKPAVPRPKKADPHKIVTPQAAAQRAFCLRAYIRRVEIEAVLMAAKLNPEAAKTVHADKLQAEARNINEWLKDEELWICVSPAEKNLLNLQPGAWSLPSLKNATWRAEALGVIGWALGLVDEILPYDKQLDKISFAYRWEIFLPTQRIIAEAKLREEKDILRAREIAENWLWRARTTRIQKDPKKYPPPPGWTYEKIILAAAEHWEKDGLFKAVKGDYPARGKAYREQTEEEWQEMQSIATERLYGLNWLCKFSEQWDAVPTGT